MTREPTPFEQAVYDVTRRIPRGYVATYGGVARAVGCGSAQAIGQALKRNPFAPEVPCHRVVAADLRMGGFGGSRSASSLARKRALLDAEGVRFEDGDRVTSACLHTPAAHQFKR